MDIGKPSAKFASDGGFQRSDFYVHPEGAAKGVNANDVNAI
jgi:hypothetical protein